MQPTPTITPSVTTQNLPNGGGSYQSPTTVVGQGSSPNPSQYAPNTQTPIVPAPAGGDASAAVGNAPTDQGIKESDIAYTANAINNIYKGKSAANLYAEREKLSGERSDILGGILNDPYLAAKQQGVPFSIQQDFENRKAAAGKYDTQIGDLDSYIAAEKAAAGSGATATADELQKAADAVSAGEKITDYPANLRVKINALITKSVGSAATIVKQTADSLDDLQTYVDQDHGFTGAVGAKGFSSLFGLKSAPFEGSPAADFDAKLDKVVNGTVLPNLTLLHGLGRITDREFQTLKSGLTDLSTKQSETAFKASLNTLNTFIKAKLADEGTTSSDTSGLDDTAQAILSKYGIK